MPKKTSKSKHKRAPAKSNKAPAASPSVIVASRVLRSLPALGDAARRAFDAQTTAGEQAQLGGRTKSDGVLREAAQWISAIDSAKRKFGGAIAYGEVRLAYLCTVLLDLADARESASGARDGAAKAAASREAALGKARAVRTSLLHKLEQIARGNAHDEAALEAVESDTRHDESLASGLDKLASRADAVLARTDETTRALVAGAELEASDAEQARAAKDALVTAGVAATDAGRRQAKDSPAVNLAEGRVLAEMRVAEKAFRQAHDQNPAIPRLVPGPAVRQVIGARPHGARAHASTPAAPSQGNGAATQPD